MIGIDKKGKIVQEYYLEFNTDAYKYGNDLSITLIPDTEFNISTTGNSKLRVIFSASTVLSLPPNFTSAARFNITLSIDETFNKTARVSYFSNYALPDIIQISYTISIILESETLSKGLHNVKVFWNSIYDSGNSVFLIMYNANFRYPRSLLIEEIGTANLFGL